MEPAKRYDSKFLSEVRGLPWDPEDGIVRGRPRKIAAPPGPVVALEQGQAPQPAPQQDKEASAEENKTEAAKMEEEAGKGTKGHEFDISTPPPPAKVMKKAPPEAEPGGPPRALEYEEYPSPDKPEQKRAR